MNRLLACATAAAALTGCATYEPTAYPYGTTGYAPAPVYGHPYDGFYAPYYGYFDSPNVVVFPSAISGGVYWSDGDRGRQHWRDGDRGREHWREGERGREHWRNDGRARDSDRDGDRARRAEYFRQWQPGEIRDPPATQGWTGPSGESNPAHSDPSLGR